MRFRLARAICRWLPPLAAQRVRSWVWPLEKAQMAKISGRVRAVTGGWFEGSTFDIHAYPMLVHGYYEWRNVAICAAVLEPGATVVEVGANVGTETVCFADLAKETGGRVVAFEPDEGNFSALRRLAALNGWRHVEIVQAAISDHEGDAWFVPPPSNGLSGIGRVVASQEAGGAVRVRSVRLDSLFPPGSSRVGAVFVDVEGYEVAVLRGAAALLQRDRPVVVLEASPRLLEKNGWRLEDLASEIRACGYMSWRIGRFGLEPAETGVRRASNWLCLPEEGSDKMRVIQNVLWRAGWLPMIRGLNPLAGHRG